MTLENKRLALCAELVGTDGFADGTGKKRAADVGTDHGYLAAYLAAEGICERVTACDINEKPLALAERTVRENGLSDRVRTVLSDGLDSVENDRFTHIICAGMGGELIADIIGRCEWARDVHLVLQPMTKADFLRGYLYRNGFRIERELAVRDGDFIYSVILAAHTDAPLDYPCDKRYLAAGRLIAGERGADDYLRMRAARLRKSGEGMLSSNDPATQNAGRLSLELAEALEAETAHNTDTRR